ncbi:hypothetical protein RJP21_08310 [Paenibacillus sp. VCA1]|uniref:hypothetical protein n=1 Tax=Paenibacillus sp. VCA1 TaxID=3039148 RepID=UPI0028717EC3|nr:hypothetical protein [Paenibacillus sp. VCA1]MDR9853601.1 hypothetical protein [Paenibacillus sp. VCA1]
MILSTDQDCIHERADRRMEPFYWILTFEVMTFVLALGAALVIGPLYLAYRFQSWAFLLLVLLVPGLWLIRFSVRYLRSAIRKNRLLSRYRLYRDRIEYRIYHHPDTKASEGAVPLDRIERIYVSYYVALYHYAYRKSKFNEQQPTYHILPMVNVVYRDETNRRVLGVPFYEYFDAEQWLKELQSRDIPIWATAVLPGALPEEEQLRLLEDESNSRPFPFHHHLQKELEQLVSEIEQSRPEEAGGADGTAPQQEAGERPPAGIQRFKPQWTTLVIFALLFAFVYAFLKFSFKGSISSDGFGISFAVSLAGGLIYLFLAKRLTFWVPLRYAIALFLGWALIGAFMPETDAGIGEEYYISMLTAGVFTAFAIWPVFGILYWIRKKRGRRP